MDTEGYIYIYVHMYRYVYMYTHIYTHWIHDLIGVKGFRGVICGCEAWQWKSCMQGLWRRCGLGSWACVPCFAAWCLCLARCSRVQRVLGCKLDFKRGSSFVSATYATSHLALPQCYRGVKETIRSAMGVFKRWGVWFWGLIKFTIRLFWGI